ncbi:hypothetical protein [Hyphomicrobium sp. CS1GBMeth3]|uniref:hypothetical protein n=1 Tax=Hyphomicrobium sp. CS1GBMeth3 TaxID=1892845 RepID=UPI000931D09D|nr:hypothetical protein [Hyphomicrobium sp. CS1GBMeth3]
MSVDGVQITLCVVGAFYAFAGYVATRAALTSHILDRAIAAIASTRPSNRETAQSMWLLAAATVVLAGGVALVFLLDIAAWLFLASAIGQALYLFYVAPRYFDTEDPPDPRGRRQSTNAFVLYVLATAFVLWALSTDRLTNWQDAGWLPLAGLAVVLAAHVGYVIRILVGTPASRASKSAGKATSGDTPPGLDPSKSKRVKVMTDYYAHPLWTLDEHSYGDFPPEALGLSPELTRDLNAWAEDYTSSLDPDDPAASLWSADQNSAHEAKARPLAVRLARERPDLMIYVMDAAGGVVEVHADEEI